MADLFHQIPDGVAILQSGGVYKQVDLYERAGYIYAKWGSGFVGLRSSSKGTSHPRVLWVELEGITPHYDDLGRMTKSPTIRRVAA